MIITRKNVLGVANDLQESYVQSSSLYYKTGFNDYFKTMKKQMLLKSLIEAERYFVGAIDKSLINMTEFYINHVLMGQDANTAMHSSICTRYRKGDSFYWKYHRIDEYVSFHKLIHDPWDKPRLFLKTQKVYGFIVHDVIVSKNTVICTVLFSDGFNVFATQTAKMMQYGSKWYFTAANAKEYEFRLSINTIKTIYEL